MLANVRSRNQWGSVESYQVSMPEPGLPCQPGQVLADVAGDISRRGKAGGIVSAQVRGQSRAGKREVREMPGDGKLGAGFLARSELDRADQGTLEPGTKRLLRGQITAEDRLGCGPRGDRGNAPIGSERLEQRQGHRAVIAAPSQGNPGRPRGVGQLDLIDIDMSPVARVLIDDLDACGLALQVADIPAGPFHRVGALAGRRADDLSVNLQIDAGLVGMIASADQEIQVVALDRERGRGQLALSGVAAGPGIDQPLALKTAQMLLGTDCSGAGASAEGLAFGGPRSRRSRRRSRPGRSAAAGLAPEVPPRAPPNIRAAAVPALDGSRCSGTHRPAARYQGKPRSRASRRSPPRPARGKHS